MTAANQRTIVEIELLATVGWKCGCQPFSCPRSQNVTHCRKEICSTCSFKESIPAIPFWNSKRPLAAGSRFLRAAVRSALWLHHARPFVAAAGKRCVLCREAEGLVAEFFSPRFVTMQWLCSQLCYLTAANQWTIVEIELLATVGWKCGCQPFSCPCPQNVTHSRKEIYGTCSSKESIPAINLGIPSIRSLPESWGSWERQYVPAALLYSCIMPMSSLQLKENTCLMQRSREIGHRVVVSKICYSTVIVPSVVLFDCCTPMNNSRDWAFSNSGLEMGLPAFQLPMSAKCDALRKKEICWTRSFKESIPAIPFWNSKRPLAAGSRFLRAAVRSALWLHHARPFVAAAGKRCVSCREAEGLVAEFFSPRFVTMQWLCSELCYLTAANQWTIVEIDILAAVGWKCGCQPFSWPCSQNVTHCEKRRFVGHVRLRNPFPPFLFGIPSVHSLPEAGSWERQCALHYGCIMPVPLLQRQEKDASYAEKQRVWSRSFFLQDLLQCSDCALSCAMWLLQTNEQL